MKIQDVRKKYKNEWVLGEILKDGVEEPKRLRIIEHSKDQDNIYRAMKETEAKQTYHFYTGKIPKDGYAVAF